MIFYLHSCYQLSRRANRLNRMSIPFKHPVLFVEDDPNDLLFMKRALQRGNLPFTIYHVLNGEEAISYLRGEGRYGDRGQYPLPSLVISNMKMPRMNGLELLKWIRQQPALKQLPVAVLSSSGDPKEVEKFEVLGVNSYFIKPVDINDLAATLQQMETWLPPLA
jgi:CheY-like chemotaxis protein